MSVHVSVFYSRSVYVSTCWRDVQCYYLTTRHMNCHRRERSGVFTQRSREMLQMFRNRTRDSC